MKKQLLRMGLLAAVFTVLLCVGALAANEPTQSGIYDVIPTSDSGASVSLNYASSTVSIGGKECTFYAGAEKMSVSLNSTKQNPITDGEQYVIFVTNTEGVPTKDNLVYINQEAASGNTVTFSTVYPSKLENGKTYYVYITGGNRILNETNKTPVATFKYFAPYKLGDINEDKKVTATDALWALQAAAGNRTLVGGPKSAADVNLDNKITATDALWILQAAAGNRVLG